MRRYDVGLIMAGLGCAFSLHAEPSGSARRFEENALSAPALFVDHFARRPHRLNAWIDLFLQPARAAAAATAPAGLGWTIPVPQERPAPAATPRPDGLTLDVSWTARDMLQIFRLTYRAYRKEGRIPRDASAMFDPYPEFDAVSKIFTVKQRGVILGTLSYVLDSAPTRSRPYGLTFERDFPIQVRRLRATGARIAGAWRFAIDPGVTESQNLRVSLLLIDAVMREAEKDGVAHILFGTSPAHAARWTSLLSMVRIGFVPNAGGFKDAPETLLVGNLHLASTSPLRLRLQRRERAERAAA